MHLFLGAVDVWLFRDGRPFDALSDHRAESLFPPYPSVIQGAIRSHHLVVKGVDLCNKQKIAEAVGTTEDYKSLRLRGPFIVRRENGKIVRYLPQPADAVKVTGGEKHKIKTASPPQAVPDTIATGSATTHLLGLQDEPVKGEPNLWFAEKTLFSYLAGEEVSGFPASKLFKRESRYGIGRDDQSYTSKDGAFYEVEFIRPCLDVGLLVEVNGYEDWPAEGAMRIGGEGRGAYFHQIDAPVWPSPPEVLPSPRFKLYFATPACFEGGWQPREGNWTKFFTGSVKLAAAALNRYESIGGFDWAGNRQKPARRCVPAGSVYYFISNNPVSFVPDLMQNAVTDSGAEIGFGQIIVKEW